MAETLKELIERVKAGHYPQGLFDKGEDNEGWEGSCPCFSGKFEVDDYPAYIWGRCWRVSDNDQDLYLYTDHPRRRQLGNAIKKQLDAQEWYHPYTLILGDYKDSPEALSSAEGVEV